MAGAFADDQERGEGDGCGRAVHFRSSAAGQELLRRRRLQKRLDGVDVVALVDVDDDVAAQRKGELEKKRGAKVDTYRDIRARRKEIDGLTKELSG